MEIPSHPQLNPANCESLLRYLKVLEFLKKNRPQDEYISKKYNKILFLNLIRRYSWTILVG